MMQIYEDREWIEEITQLGMLGRKNLKKVCSFEEIQEEDGLYRIEGSDSMDASLKYLLGRMEELELEIFFDSVGNLYGSLKGTDQEKPGIAIGSHLDSVADGGMFDGVVGVVGALEAIRRLKKDNHIPKRDITLIVFMGEEGSAVLEACLGSQYICGKITKDEVYNLTSSSGEKFYNLLKRTGKIESAHAVKDFKVNDFDSFLELHIEQGPVLENNNLPVGLVNAIYGIRSYKVSIKGLSNHAGSTPMSLRKDALYGASQFIHKVTDYVSSHKEKYNCVLTFDTFEIFPNSPSIIPNEVKLTIDARSDTITGLNMMDTLISTELEQICSPLGLTWTIQKVMDFNPTELDKNLNSKISKIIEDLKIDYMILPSGAIHDSMHIAEKIQTSLIFVQSLKGVSHSPYEWSSWDHIESGIDILTESLKKLDEKFI